MKTLSYFFHIALAISLLACTKPDVPEVIGSVQGQVYNPMTEQGVPNINMFLLDKDAKIDTITYNNQHVYVDSTITDSNGNYKIDSIGPGNYLIAPIDERTTFKHEASSQAYEFEIIEGENYTVNYNTEPPIVMGGGFTIKITFINESYVNEATWINVSRRMWAFFVPTYSKPNSIQTIINPADNSERLFSAVFSYGYTAVAFTIDNMFEFRFADNVFHIYFPLDAAPESSNWQYDCTSKVLTRLD